MLSAGATEAETNTMALSHRLLTTLEAELNKLVVFGYDRVRRLNASGSQRTFLRVWLRNDAPVALTGVRGTICPASSQRPFESTSFEVELLAPGGEVEIALIPAERFAEVTDRAVLDSAAIVRFRSGVDLSGFAVSSLARPVAYAERLTTWERRVRPERKVSRARAQRGAALPLSH